MHNRIKLSLIFTILLVGFVVLSALYGPTNTAQSGMLQMQQTEEAYVQSILNNPNTMVTIVIVVYAVIMAVIWLPVIFGGGNNNRANSNILPLVLLVLVFAFLGSACQAGHTVRIESYQTAFLIPAVGDANGQAQTRSIEFYEKNKVNAQDVIIGKYCSQVGGVFTCEWRDAQILYTVNRTPVSRQWTAETETGTSPNDDSFRVETKESHGFWVGAVIQAEIHEEDAAAFLFYYPAPDNDPNDSSAAAKSLATIMDEDIRLFVGGQLFDRFKQRTTDEVIDQVTVVFEETFAAARDFYSKRGITINYIQPSEGLRFENPEIQAQIDRQFVASQQMLLAKATATGQAIENDRLVSAAQAVATTTAIAAKSEANIIREQGQALRENPEILNYTMAQQWNGQLPMYMGGGNSGMPVPFIMMGSESLSSATQPPPTYLPSPTLIATATPVATE